jgi:hypothetical protein
MLVPHHLTFVYKDTEIDKFCCLDINIPSGLARDNICYWFQSAVPTCQTCILVACLQPDFMYNPNNMIEGVALQLENKDGAFNIPVLVLTAFNIYSKQHAIHTGATTSYKALVL